MRLITPWLWLFLFVCCWGSSLAIPQQLVEDLKISFLPLFGLTEPPKLNHNKVTVPEVMKKLYQLQTDFDLDTVSIPLPGRNTQTANTVRSFTHIETRADRQFPGHFKFRLFFNVSAIPETEDLKAAEVVLTAKALPGNKKRYQHIVVKDIILTRGKTRQVLTRIIDSKYLDTRKNDSIVLDVAESVRRWKEDSSSNHGLIVEVIPYGNSKLKRHVRIRRDEGDGDWGSLQPLLITYTDDGSVRGRKGEELMHIRSKRGLRSRQRKGDRDPCRRRQMYVDFGAVGWSDWIVAPLGYDAFYCAGECEYPMAEHMNTTNHAIVQSLMNSVRPTDVPKPCCVPTQLSSMSMLYLNSEGKIMLKNYNGMVVTGCGCR